jgi:hypothetical protein
VPDGLHNRKVSPFNKREELTPYGIPETSFYKEFIRAQNLDNNQISNPSHSRQEVKLRKNINLSGIAVKEVILQREFKKVNDRIL